MTTSNFRFPWPSRRAAYVAGLTLVLGVCVLATGCASGPERNPRDPFEPFNRSVYNFNEAIDQAVLKPVATGYRNFTPSVVRTGVGNFFRNLSEPWSFVNNVLQLKVQDAGETVIRFSINTVFGIGGLLDIAGDFSIEQHKQDFGRTLAFYRVPTGPYLVLPLLGPSTVRDTAALPVEVQGDLVTGLDDVAVRNSLYVLRVVDVRASLLRASSILDDAALDKYSFTRDAYLQVRRNRPRRDTTESDNDGDVD